MLNTKTSDEVAYQAEKRFAIGKATAIARTRGIADYSPIRDEFWRQFRRGATALVWLPTKNDNWFCPCRDDPKYKSFTVYMKADVWKVIVTKANGVSKFPDNKFPDAVAAKEYVEHLLDKAGCDTTGHYRNIYYFYY